jgi:putative inorganic carbon (hco3(-)) transporter
VPAVATPSGEAAPKPWARLLSGGAPSVVVTFLLILAGVGVAVVSGVNAEGSKLAVVLPVAVAAGILLGLLALTRFRLYVMVMLALRASMDLSKVSSPATVQGVGDTTARGLDPSSILAVLFLVTAVLWLAAQQRKQGRLPGSPLRAGLLAFAAAGALSMIGSQNLRASALEVLRILAAVAMFVVLEQIMIDRASTRRVLLAVYASTLFPLAFTIFGFLIGHPRSEVKGAFTRLTGPFNQSNTFGRYLMLMIIFGVAIYPYIEKKLRLPLGIILALSSGFLLLTYTLTALVGTIIGLVVVGLIQSKRLLLILAVLCVASLVAVPRLADRVSGVTGTVSSQGQSTTVNSLDWRLNYWTTVLPLANENPVTGVGLGVTQYLTAAQDQPHNDYLRAYVETGLIGLGAFLAMLFTMVAMGRRAVRVSRPGTFERGVGAGFLGCAVAYAAASLAANLVSNVVILWYLFAFAAASAAVVRSNRPGQSIMASAGDPERISGRRS